MYTVKRDQAELMQLPKRDVRCFIGPDKMNTPVKSKHMTMGMTEVPAHVDMLPHLHDEEEEIIFIIEGTGEVTVGGVTETLEPFTAVKFPVTVEHQVRNTGDTVMKFVFMFNPPSTFGR